MYKRQELGQFVTDFIWYLRNLLLLKTADDAENMLDMSEDNLSQLREETKLVDGETLMRFIRVFSDLSGNLRYGNQKRVLVEVALIRLTKPQMECSLDSLIQRLEELEERLDNMGNLPDTVALGQIALIQAKESENVIDQAPLDETVNTVAIPKAQLEDLNLIRQDWGKIVKELGEAIRPAFRETILEPGGDGCLCIVFSSQSNFDIGNRATVLGALDAYVKEHYGKEIYFKVRLKNSGERMNTLYVSDEELKAIHMDITIED